MILISALALAVDPVPCDKAAAPPISILVIPEEPAAPTSLLVMPEPPATVVVAAEVSPLVPVTAPVAVASKRKDEDCKVKPKP
jgi:hypothetical protein